LGVGASCADIDDAGSDEILLVTHDRVWCGNLLFENREGVLVDVAVEAGVAPWRDGHGQAGEAHCDASPDRVDAMARALYERTFPGAPSYSRFLYTSFWRTFSPPPQDYPLALCDGNSVGDDEGVPNTLFIVDRIPGREEMLKPVNDEHQMIAAAIFHHNPNHRWWYFSNMTRDEVLLLVFHDSRRVQPWRVPHTAFHDRSRPDANRRESVEFRSVAYFQDA
jgi:hypothetical protein